MQVEIPRREHQRDPPRRNPVSSRVSPCVTLPPSFHLIAWTTVPFLCYARSCRFHPCSSPFALPLILTLLLPVVVPSRLFASQPPPPGLALRSYHSSSRRATLKLAFSLLSSEAADFPHFTFQSHGGCDFLPHFHSDNIEGAPK